MEACALSICCWCHQDKKNSLQEEEHKAFGSQLHWMPPILVRIFNIKQAFGWEPSVSCPLMVCYWWRVACFISRVTNIFNITLWRGGDHFLQNIVVQRSPQAFWWFWILPTCWWQRWQAATYWRRLISILFNSHFVACFLNNTFQQVINETFAQAHCINSCKLKRWWINNRLWWITV